MRDERTGIYLRGRTYWLNFQTKGKRYWISLETDDLPEAIQRAREMRINPTLNNGDSFNSEIDRFLAYKRRTNVFTGALPWVTPHTLRHTFASLLASAGVSLYKIAKWLGDSPNVVEKRYANLLPNDPDIERAHSVSFQKER